MANWYKLYVRNLKIGHRKLLRQINTVPPIRLLVLTVIVLTIPLTVFLVQRISRLFTEAEVETVFLFQNAQDNILTTQTTRTLQLVIQGGSSKVGFVKVELNFEPSKIRLSDEIISADALRKEIVKTSLSEANQNGKIELVYGLVPEDRNISPFPATGTFIIANLPFTAVSNISNESALIEINTASVQLVDMNFNLIPFAKESYAFTLNPSADPSSLISRVATTAPEPALTLTSAIGTTPFLSITPPPKPNYTITSTSVPEPTSSLSPNSQTPLGEKVLFPVADTFVSMYPSGKAFGKQNILQVDAFPLTKVTYLKFDLGDYFGNIISAKLRLHIADIGYADSRSQQSVKEVADGNWSETEMTFANRPVSGYVLGKIKGGAGSRGEWLEVDVSKYIQSKLGTLVSFAIDAPILSWDGLIMDSKESNNPPEIVIVMSN